MTPVPTRAALRTLALRAYFVSKAFNDSLLAELRGDHEQAAVRYRAGQVALERLIAVLEETARVEEG